MEVCACRCERMPHRGSNKNSFSSSSHAISPERTHFLTSDQMECRSAVSASFFKAGISLWERLVFTQVWSKHSLFPWPAYFREPWPLYTGTIVTATVDGPVEYIITAARGGVTFPPWSHGWEQTGYRTFVRVISRYYILSMNVEYPPTHKNTWMNNCKGP